MSDPELPTHPDSPPLRAADRIRASARELFYRVGIRAVGVEQIVEQAGVTKPSLYRSFPSKDELAAAYLRDYDAYFWQRFEAPREQYPDDPRGQLLAYLDGLAGRAGQDGYRGCGLTNAAVEYPDREHPARKVAEANKQALRARLLQMSEAMGASDAPLLADGLLLLIEGVFASGQLFGSGGPALRVTETARRLIDGALPAAGGAQLLPGATVQAPD